MENIGKRNANGENMTKMTISDNFLFGEKTNKTFRKKTIQIIWVLSDNGK